MKVADEVVEAGGRVVEIQNLKLSLVFVISELTDFQIKCQPWHFLFLSSFFCSEIFYGGFQTFELQ